MPRELQNAGRASSGSWNICNDGDALNNGYWAPAGYDLHRAYITYRTTASQRAFELRREALPDHERAYKRPGGVLPYKLLLH